MVTPIKPTPKKNYSIYMYERSTQQLQDWIAHTGLDNGKAIGMLLDRVKLLPNGEFEIIAYKSNFNVMEE